MTTNGALLLSELLARWSLLYRWAKSLQNKGGGLAKIMKLFLIFRIILFAATIELEASF